MWAIFLGVILGWLLSLLTQPIVERIRNRYKKKEVKRGIFTELKEYKYRKTLSAWNLLNDFGICDKDLINWTLNNIKSYEGSFAYKTKAIVEDLEKLSQLKDEQVKEYTAKARKRIGRSLKKDDLAYINSNLGYLPLFDTDFHNKVLEIRSHNMHLSDEIELAMYYYKMTFDTKLDNNNQKIINQNLDLSYRNITNNLRNQVDRINQLLVNNGNMNWVKKAMQKIKSKV